MTVHGLQDLVSALTAMYIDREELTEENQYQCDHCQRKVDADKVLWIMLSYLMLVIMTTIAPNGYSLLVVGVPQCHCRGEHCANCIHLPRLSGGPAAQFFVEASRASLQHGWRSTYSLRETLSPTQDHTGPLVVSRESGAPVDQVEETPGRASLEKLGCRTTPQLHAGGVGRQQQHDNLYSIHVRLRQ